MQYRFLLLLVFSFCLTTSVFARDITTIQTFAANETPLKIYEEVTVDFDHTENVWYIETDRPIDFNITSENKFEVWEVSLNFNSQNLFFDPRPLISSPQETSGVYLFSYQINETYANGTTKLFMLTFSASNVKEQGLFHFWRGSFWYPFDKYEVFLMNRTIEEGMYRISYIQFPFPDPDIEDIENSMSMNPFCPIIGDAGEYSSSQNLIKTRNTILTSGIGLKNGEIPYLKPTLTYSNKDYTCQISNVKEGGSFLFGRTFFPSKLLFYFLLLYTGAIVLLTMKREPDKPFLHILYIVYIRAGIAVLIAEFTVGFLPPSRPLHVTLFDFLILWPLIFYIFLHGFKKLVAPNISNPHEESSNKDISTDKRGEKQS